MTAGRATTTRRGSRPPFEQVVADYRATGLRVPGDLDPADAEDADRHVVSAMRAYPSPDPAATAAGWSRSPTIASTSSPRAGGRSRPIAFDEPRPPHAIDADGQHDVLQHYAPRQQRTAVVYYPASSVSEIARAMAPARRPPAATQPTASCTRLRDDHDRSPDDVGPVCCRRRPLIPSPE
jgi:hypothetical protein